MTDIYKSFLECEGINLRMLSHKERRRLIKKFKRKLKRQEIGKARKNATKLFSDEIQTIKSKINQVENLRKTLEKAEHKFQESIWLKNSQEIAKLNVEKSNNSESIAPEIEESNVANLPRGKVKPPQYEKLYFKTQSSESNKSSSSELNINSRHSKTFNANQDPYHNPFPPEDYDNSNNSQITQQDICYFFAKTGACKFGDNCNKIHTPAYHFTDISTANVNTSTLLIRNMFDKVGFTSSMSYEGEDVTLENDDIAIYNDFKEFYNDAYPVFAQFGTIVDFRVCSNHQKHLRGNVYIKYRTQEDCIRSFSAFNGRLFDSRRLICEFCRVDDFDAATCRMTHCSKGNDCNFWHIFKNPCEKRKHKDRSSVNK